MKSVPYNIDPDGDVEIILKKHGTYQTTPEVRFRTSSGLQQDTSQVDDSPVKSGLVIPEEDSSKKPIEIRMRVSSHHLTFASPVFKKMLTGPWKEALSSASSNETTSPSSNPPAKVVAVREISAEGWNAHAFVMLLEIIHGRNSMIPTKVTLKFFADFAAISDYYDCTNSVSLAARAWYPWTPKPQKDSEKAGRSCIMWLHICRVFDWGFFEDMARVYIKNSQGIEMIKTNDLPIAGLLDKLEVKRQQYIGQIMAKLADLSDKYLTGSLGCKIDCRCTAYGSLIIARANMRNLDPPLDISQYKGYSYADVKGEVKAFSRTKTCHKAKPSTRCNLTNVMCQVFEKIESEIGQVKLSDFKLSDFKN